LRVHRVHRNDASFEIEGLEQFYQGGNLIALFVDFGMCQSQLSLRQKERNDMSGRFIEGFVGRSSHCFPIGGHKGECLPFSISYLFCPLFLKFFKGLFIAIQKNVTYRRVGRNGKVSTQELLDLFFSY